MGVKSKADLKKVKVEFWTRRVSLCEIMQPTGILFAFLSSKDNGYKQCHTWIKCRDFLQDAVRNHITGNNESIYGFSYDPKTDPPIDMDRMRMLVTRKLSAKKEGASEELREIIKSALSIIHRVEKHGKIKPLTKLYLASGKDDVYIFMGSKDWMDSSFMISLYTFLIRLGAKTKGKEFKTKKELDSALGDLAKKSGDHDIGYLKSILPYIYKVVNNRKDLKLVKEDGVLTFAAGINTFHNYSGVVSLCREFDGKLGNHGMKELTNLAKALSDKRPAPKKKTKMKKAGA